MVNSKDFARRLEKIMDAYEFTASAFADEIDVGRSSISHILSGRNKPSLEFVMKIVETFPEVELYWLLNGKGNFPKQAEKSRAAEPDLFNEEEEPVNPPKTSQKPPETALNLSKMNTGNRQISRIVIFYDDGTFENFISES